MSDLLIKVVKIDSISEHPQADRLEIIKIGGWQIVSGKGNYKVGDLAVHVPPECMVPKEWADKWGVTQYLSWRNNATKGRVKAVKLRLAPSYGFLAPNDTNAEIGTNLADHYGIEKYEEPVQIGRQAGQMSKNHPLFHTYTNIQNLRNFPKALFWNEPLIVTEKIHGCLPYSTRINMADGTKKKIGQIKIDDLVLGVDKNGSVIPTKVLNTFNNGPAKEWMSFEGERRNAGRGNSFFSVKCTPNHKIWIHAHRMHDQGNYSPASNLQIGDYISLIRSELEITPLQEQVLIGKMLGDGSLSISNNTASISFGHKQDHEEYLHWTLQGLGDIAGNQQKNQISGYGTVMCRARTISSFLIREYFQSWYSSGKKEVPGIITTIIGPIALAFWYMDDGSLSHHTDQEDRINLAICGFNDNSTNNLREALLKFGINSSAYKSDENSYNRLRLNANDAEKFFLLIAPYIPSCMQYKLPERYRGHSGWLPTSKSQYKPVLVEQQINKINRNIECDSAKHDIETETHNFFANGILVHNSNSRIGWVRSPDPENIACPDILEKVVGTHKTQRKLEDCGTYGLPFELYGEALEKIKDTIIEAMERNLIYSEEGGIKVQSLILFGEIFGPGIQDLTYGLKNKQEWRLFDIAVNGAYLPWNYIEEICKQYDIPMVPRLTPGFFNFEELCALAEGTSVLSPGQIKEGIVVRPLIERTWQEGTLDPNPRRMIFKVINSDYLTRKNGTEHQ